MVEQEINPANGYTRESQARFSAACIRLSGISGME